MVLLEILRDLLLIVFMYLFTFPKKVMPKGRVFMWLYLGLYGLQFIILIMKIVVLLIQILLMLTSVLNEPYKSVMFWSIITHYPMRYIFLLYTYIAFLTFFPAKQMERLNINGDQGGAPKRPNLTQAELLDLCLVGRVMVNKPIHIATLEARLDPIWEPKYQMTLILMDDNKFIVQLYSKADLARILDRSPWLLDKNMIILKKVDVGEDPLTMAMNTMEIWAQVHQFPFGFMDEKVGALVGSHIGKMVSVQV